VNTRKLEPSDAALAQSVLTQFHGREVSTEYLAQWLRNPAHYLLVAEADGAIVGRLSAYALDSLDREAAAMFIYEIDVAENFRRRGAGAALIAHIKSLADEKRILRCLSSPTTPTQALWPFTKPPADRWKKAMS
jgi:aminoglycoside 3-N-acetyltransferase I